MEWEQWLEYAKEYFKNVWGLSDRFSPLAAQLLGYFYFYGLNPQVTSGLRTRAKQEELRRRYEQGDPHIVYPPSKNSKHLTGDAVDISTSNPKMAHAIARFLGVRVIPGDRVHFMI